MAQDGQHALAHLEAVDGGAQRVDLARDLEPRHEGQARALLVAAGDHQPVGEVDPGRTDADAHAAGARLGHRQLGRMEALEPDELTALHGAHFPSPPCPARAGGRRAVPEEPETAASYLFRRLPAP